MEELDPLSPCANRRAADRFETRSDETLSFAVEIVDGEGDMVDPLASFLDEARDDRIWFARMQKLQPAFSEAQMMGDDLLRGDLLDPINGEAHCVAEDTKGGLNVADGDSDVINPENHRSSQKSPPQGEGICFAAALR